MAQAAAVLRAGGLVAFPTETVYGLGANALDRAAVASIFAAKGRPAANPLIVHVSDAASAHALVEHWPTQAEQLAQHFWPGPLTLVLPRKRIVPDVVTAGGPTVAIRMPAHPVALALLSACGLPLAAPSANPSSCLSPTRAEHVLAALSEQIDLILDAGPTPGGLESTVLDLTTQPPCLLRPGLLTPGQLEEVVGPVARLVPGAGDSRPPLSPGLLGRHYAPRTPIELAPSNGRSRVEFLTRQGFRVGWLVLCGDSSAALCPTATVVMPEGAAAYSAQLYAKLHELDELGLDRLIVDLPPATDEWLAVRDRLHRAAGAT